MARRSREKDFDRIGGLKEHIEVLKEMIIYPLLYREVFENHGIEAPRGVLFHGPPGTGKTLTAGAVAAECSKSSNRRVSFYMRKGADCLNKYVGESEKHLRNLFNQAYNTRPSIIFFDEIDGLVPTRSESQEVHASIVSTLLALMDGLDSKSEVFVIGATNRIDMIDPALRRPGRFDRELYFPLPSLESRIQIFHIHMRNWKWKPSPDSIYKLASECSGYCGADIQSLCSQAVIRSFHRHFPQIADTTKKHLVNCRNIKVEEEDFWEAKQSMVPAGQRNHVQPHRPLSPELEPLLKRNVDACLEFIHKSCPFKFLFHNTEECMKKRGFTCPRVLLIGKEGQGHVLYMAPAILHSFDHLPVILIDFTALSEVGNRNLMQKFEEARQNMQSIVYLKDISSWWDLIDDTEKQMLVMSIETLNTCNVSQVFLFGTISAASYEDIPKDVKKIFPENKAFFATEPSNDERMSFFKQLLHTEKNAMQPSVKKETLNGDYLSISGRFEISNSFSPRRSLRQRGLDAEYQGLNQGNNSVVTKRESLGRGYTVSKPRPRSYYRQYIYPAGLNYGNGISSRRRSIRRENVEAPIIKKMKMDDESDIAFKVSSFHAERSGNALFGETKLEEVLRSAVDVTEAYQVDSIIRLYEELEIIMLRYNSKGNLTSLPQELEREISAFAQG